MKIHHVKKARKDYPEAGIKKGESYYWWKPRYGGIRRSKTYPSRQELTQSDFLCRVYDIEDELNSIEIDIEGKSREEIEQEIENELQGIIGEIEDLRDECEEKLDNMPEQLQDTSDAGMLLQERIEALDGWINDLENIDINIEEEEELEKMDEMELQVRIDEILDEISECCYGGS